MPDERKARRSRETKETRLAVEINLDGAGAFEGSVGVPFLEHMLALMTKQALFDLVISGEGDIEIDAHHTVEDLGLLLGDAFKEALGDKRGIERYGEALTPMDEALASVALDLCDRPFFVFKGDLPKTKVGDFDVELVEEFLRAFVTRAGATAHFKIEASANLHHSAEALFKCLGRALRRAVTINPRIQGVPSTKGVL